MEEKNINFDKVIYKHNGKTITVIREFAEDSDNNVSILLDTLLEIVEGEEKRVGNNDE